MTEAEWLAATDPGPMLTFLRATGGAGDRKLLLLEAAQAGSTGDMPPSVVPADA